MHKIFWITALGIILFSCTNTNYVPKPIGYPRIYLPTFNHYNTYNTSCPYTFEYPDYVLVQKDSFYFDKQVVSDCWINIVYPTLNAKVHFSYKEIGKEITLDKVMEDSHELAYTHTKKADYIDEFEIDNANGIKGLMTNIGGNAANNLQFYLTDYKQHYIRGAVYFNSHPNIDSIQPALDFVKKDMYHFFETFNWK